MREGAPRPRRLHRLLAAAACAASLAAPAAALANNPLTGTPAATSSTPSVTTPATTATVTTATATTSASGTGGGINAIETAGIGVVVVVLFLSIAWVIHSDARLHAPTRRQTIDINRERGTVRPRAERVKSSRAKAKAARRARRAGR
jgi:predicted lipid-binding transport protein (Tim44 family)